jgi:hypothetical protein
VNGAAPLGEFGFFRSRAIIEVAAPGVSSKLNECMLEPSRMGAIESSAFGHKGIAPVPEIFVHMMSIKARLDLIALPHINRGQVILCPLARAYQDIDARRLELLAFADIGPLRPRKRNPPTSPVLSVNDFDTIRVTGDDVNMDGIGLGHSCETAMLLSWSTL